MRQIEAKLTARIVDRQRAVMFHVRDHLDRARALPTIDDRPEGRGQIQPTQEAFVSPVTAEEDGLVTVGRERDPSRADGLARDDLDEEYARAGNVLHAWLERLADPPSRTPRRRRVRLPSLTGSVRPSTRGYRSPTLRDGLSARG